MSAPSTHPTTTKTKRSLSLTVNDKQVSVDTKETLLSAALRQGVEIPNSCRVGGCGTCKCKLTKGKVKELTETGYLLTQQELDDGYILACQSVPQTDVQIEVQTYSTVSATVVSQTKLTHDITRVRVQLDSPLNYRAGQFGQLSLANLPGVRRSYSFASPSSTDGYLDFVVRRVGGGKMSTALVDSDLLGTKVQIKGPMGDFYLRATNGPLLMVAGGSGLGAIVAMLSDALAKGDCRDVQVLFGAREQRDLYLTEELETLKKQWKGKFHYLPVLSAEPTDSTWQGARGLVTDYLPTQWDSNGSAYLCGPPAMIDTAIDQLRLLGITSEQVFFDRFTSTGDAAKGTLNQVANAEQSANLTDLQPEETVGEAGLLDYLKYFLFHAVGLCSATAIVAGGRYITAGLVGVLTAYIAGDALFGDDTSTPKFKYPSILTAQLWLALPLLALIVFASVWSVSTGDPLGFGAFISAAFGYDALGARAATSWGHHVSGWVLTGLMIGMVGTIPAHELTHRTWDKVSMFLGRWLLAFSFDTSFSIEHVYGHHRYVSTVHDPATAPRGRNVYFHILASTIKGNVSAWVIEADRLKKKHFSVFSWHNSVIRGYLMSVVLVALAYAMGGLVTMGYFIACALWGKSLLEIVNYMEHYGMVRDPKTPVQPRHSWNTNRRISSWSMFNLTRHSHHHAQGEVAYQDLKPYRQAPMMINGYLTTLVIAMIPPVWHRLMTPKVIAWDRDYASADERKLAAIANEKSGLSAFRSNAKVVTESPQSQRLQRV